MTGRPVEVCEKDEEGLLDDLVRPTSNHGWDLHMVGREIHSVSPAWPPIRTEK